MKQVTKYKNKKILVIGLAKSGKVAARTLRGLGAQVVINDLAPLAENEDAKEMLAAGFEVVAGGHPLALLDQGLDLIVKNPGIPYHSNSLLKEAVKRDIPIITEVEIAYELSEAPIIGITATNGKTTTTMLLYEILKQGKRRPLIAGNIGSVATSVAMEAKADEVMVTELSSFQLMGIRDFTPDISLILNITEAHLDYHITLSEYRQAKLNLIKKQKPDQYFVYNADDPVIVAGLVQTRAQGIPFSLFRKVEGAYALAGSVYYQEEKIIDVCEIMLKGEHNLQNVLGAVAVSKIYGCDSEAIRQVLRRFSGVKHRLQFVAEINGVKYYNNSKATNVTATETALQAFTEPTILIAGGLDRDHDLAPLGANFDHVKAILAFGETKERFHQLAKVHHIPCLTFAGLEEATLEAKKIATDGDCILFSPACASWDQYKNFEERGDHFIGVVKSLLSLSRSR